MTEHTKPTLADVQARLSAMTPEDRDAVHARGDAQLAQVIAKANSKQQDAPGPWDRGAPQPADGSPTAAKTGLFKLEHWFDIDPSTGEEWLIRGIIPRQV